MAVDRRNILGMVAGPVFGGRTLGGRIVGGLLAVLTGKANAADAGTLYLTAYATAGAEPSFGVAALDRSGKVLFTTATPGRAHAIMPRPGVAEAVVFARRPGRWFQTLSLARSRAGKTVEPSLKPDMLAAFDAYCDSRMRAGTSALFTLPFGADSLRWALLEQPSLKVGAAHARSLARGSDA